MIESEPCFKVDLVMWTKDSARTLETVFRRLDEVIPKKCVNRRIIVDDSSRDRTVEIAESFGWEVYPNPTSGIASGANEALRHVEADFFISIEHDVLLSKEWWKKIPQHIVNNPMVAVAQGIRIATNPVLRRFEEFIEEEAHQMSIDNNIYRTEVIRSIGGFPAFCPVSVDHGLSENVSKAGYGWIIDGSVVSDHIRPSVKEYIDHGYRKALVERRDIHTNLSRNVRILITSPLSALQIVAQTKRPEIFLFYPYYRLMRLRAILQSRPKKR